MRAFFYRPVPITILCATFLISACAVPSQHIVAGIPSVPALTLPSPPKEHKAEYAAYSLTQLSRELTQHLNQDHFQSAWWGVHIASLDTGRTLFEYQADRLLLPASNTKLFTAALALDELGQDHRILTSLYGTHPIVKHTLRGDLVLFGRGDPSFYSNPDVHLPPNPLRDLVSQLKALGLKRIMGDVVVDTRYFNTSSVGAGWEAGDLQYSFAAEATAISMANNTTTISPRIPSQVGEKLQLLIEPTDVPLQLSNESTSSPPGTPSSLKLVRRPFSNEYHLSGQLAVGASTVPSFKVSTPNIALMAGQRLKRMLATEGISLHGKIKVRQWPQTTHPSKPTAWVLLAQHASPPVQELLRDMLKPSSNLFAQNMLLHVGARREEALDSKNPALTTEQQGILALQNFMLRNGIGPQQVWFEEGSGLSRKNLSSARAISHLLSYMDRSPHQAVFRAALPIAGVDGTLKNRTLGSAAAGNAHAKTGTLKHTSALSGYVRSAAGERLVYALLLNHYLPPAGAPAATQELDKIVIMLAELAEHSEEH